MIAGFVGNPPGQRLHPTGLSLTGYGPPGSSPSHLNATAEVTRLEWKRHKYPGVNRQLDAGPPGVRRYLQLFLQFRLSCLRRSTVLQPAQFLFQLPVAGLGLNARLTLAVGAGLNLDAPPPLSFTLPPGTLLSFGDRYLLRVAYPGRDSDNGRPVSGWGASSSDWDGVHLSLGGLLSCEMRRHQSAEGWSMHEFWHADTTFWLHALEAKCDRTPNYHGGEDRPESSGEPRQTFPPNQPKEEPGMMILRKTEPGEEPPYLEAMMEELLR